MITFIGMIIGIFASDFIFVVDISKSMLRDELNYKVQESMIRYLKKNMNKGDNIYIMLFGTDVDPYYYEISYTGNDLPVKKEKLFTVIRNIKFNSDWTWMTKAFSELGKRLNKIGSKSNKTIIILTDGKNDPPPDVSNDLTYDEILSYYFDEFSQENVYMYLITLGVTPDSNLEKAIKKNKIPLKIIEYDYIPDNPIDDNKIQRYTGHDDEQKSIPIWIIITIISILFIILIIVLVLLIDRMFFPKFEDNMYLGEFEQRESGDLIEISKICLSDYNRKFKSSITSDEMGIVDTFFTFKIQRTGRVILIMDDSITYMDLAKKNHLTGNYYFYIDNKGEYDAE